MCRFIQPIALGSEENEMFGFFVNKSAHVEFYGFGVIILVDSSAIVLGVIGGIERFSNVKKLVAFPGLDPVVSQSGRFENKSGKNLKSGSPLLRPALFLAAFTAIKNSKYGLLGLYATIDLRLKSAIGGASPGSGVVPQRRSDNNYCLIYFLEG